MRLHKARLEQDDDGRWKSWIDTLPGCSVSADTQGEALVALKEAAEAHVDFKYVTVRLKVPEQGIHIPRSLLEGVEEVDINNSADRVIVNPVIDYDATHKTKDRNSDKSLWADKYRGVITLREDDPDPRYQAIIQKYLRIEKENP